MLSDIDNTDEQALLEALSEYYFTNNMSFDGLVINSENAGLFNSIKDDAINNYYED